MAWNTIVKPDLDKNRKKRKVTLQSYGGDNSWSGNLDAHGNILSQVYRGRYDRLERYKLYDWMDQDSDVSRALDITAEHCTPIDDDNSFFQFEWFLEPTEEESALVQENMQQWSRINEWNNRLWRHIRNVMKYGDWFYFRHPDTFELFSVHPRFVLGALVDRDNSEIIGWIVRNFKFNLDNIEIAVDNRALQDNINGAAVSSGLRNTKVIPAAHMMHLTLSEGKFAGASGDDDPSDRYNNRWPFGESILDGASKTFKQRELLEDAAIIHRVQRAPSRTVWYIDTGKMRSDRSTWAVNNFKNELNQKRVPQMLNGDRKGVDSVYNPISQLEDIYIPVSFDQRGSKVETLEGQPWNDLPDLEYFTKKMMRALRVPHSWLLGPQEGGSVFNDAKAGVAYQEEIEFSRHCTRIQKSIQEAFDFEFKLYSKFRDININASDYDLWFNEPTNYEEFKRNIRDQDNINVWSQVKDEPYISRRFSLKKYMNWTEDEIVENERLILEERYNNSEVDSMDDFGGGLGGGFGGGFGGGDLGLSPDLGMAGASGDLGGDLTGDLGGLGGAEPPGPGFGETTDMPTFKELITESSISSDDIVAPTPKTNYSTISSSPKDELTPLGANVEGHEDFIRNGGFKITLSMIQKIRKSHMSRRVENNKRMKMIQKVYIDSSEGSDGGGLGGLGGL